MLPEPGGTNEGLQTWGSGLRGSAAAVWSWDEGNSVAALETSPREGKRNRKEQWPFSLLSSLPASFIEIVRKSGGQVILCTEGELGPGSDR